jgi:phenylacetate-CoA ligase
MTDSSLPVSAPFFRSAIPSVEWPAVPAPYAAGLLALQYQWNRSQWLPADRLRALQLRQLDVLLRHAYRTVPYYRSRWATTYDPSSSISLQRFRALPFLTRSDLQEHYDELKSTNVPSDHGAVRDARTSGSTGRPVRVLKTQLGQLMWDAFTLRDHLWHRRDLRGKLAVIRQGVGAQSLSGWGPPAENVAVTGCAATLPITTDVDSQLVWIREQDPEYLLTYPSNVRELARRSLAAGVRLRNLRQVRTIGEAFSSDVRDLCRDAWGVEVADTYSCEEAGYVALQCPESDHYHVQSEGVLVEILDDRDAPCLPGQVGRVVVTVLHNFAMPLVRYDVGDYAEPGEPCPCGRGLPVLRRILGRVRNMLRLRSGECYWPMLGTRSFPKIAPITQHQFVQKSFDCIDLRVVTARPLTPDEERQLRAHVESRLPVPLRLEFVYVDEIVRAPSGKFEDFVSEVG